MCSSSPPAVTAAGPSVALPPGRRQTTTGNNATLGDTIHRQHLREDSRWKVTNTHSPSADKPDGTGSMTPPAASGENLIRFIKQIFQGQ